MHTLALESRDLVVEPGVGITTYTGARRLQQDLTLALAEEFGTDRFHPRFGSILNTFVGQPITSALQRQVEAEVARVLNNYLAAQRDYIAADIARTLVPTKYSTADVLAEVLSVDTKVDQDVINVTIALRNVSRETFIVTAQAAL